MENTLGESRGLLDSLRKVATTLVATMHTRLDLLVTDLEEEKEHLISLMALAVCTLFCLGVGVVLATLLLVVLFWDTHRVLLLGSLALIFLAAGVAAGAMAREKAKAKPRLLNASLSELLKDREQLASRT